MDSRFLNPYSPDELADIEDIIQHAEENYPFSISNAIKNYEECLETSDYLGAQRCLFDLFEISVQFLSGLTISLLTHYNVEFDDELQAVLRQMVEKATATGDWINRIFFVVLPKASKLLPDHPLIQHLVKEFQVNDNIFQGHQKGVHKKHIAKYRNEWGHGSYNAPEIVKKEVAELEPRAWVLLKVLMPLENYRFFQIEHLIDVESETKSYAVIPDPAPGNGGFQINSDSVLVENAYYFTDEKLRRKAFINGRSVIKLTPFIIYHEQDNTWADNKYQYVFQSLKDRSLNKLTYLSTHKHAGRLETELYRDGFLTLLQHVFGTLFNQEKFKISFHREKNLDEFAEQAKRQTTDFIVQQATSDKYNAELFLEREHLRSRFENFLTGDKHAFIMLGNAGSGKTNQICHWSSAVRPGCINMAYYSKTFATSTLDEQLKRSFDISDRSADQILDALEKLLEKEDKLLCMFFDAINECTTYYGGENGNGAIDLLTAINYLLISSKFKRIKVIISCRSYTWEEVLSNTYSLNADHYYTVGDEGHMTLSNFSDEELAIVYPKYAERYKLTTPVGILFTDRYEFVRRRLVDPLILKTSAQNYAGHSLPSEVRQFNSTRLFHQKSADLEKKEGGVNSMQILERFTSWLWRNFTDAIPVRALRDASFNDKDPLYDFSRMIYSGESLRYNVAFIQLLEEGILRIEKGSKGELRFVYERFNEYMFALEFLRLQPSAPYGRNLPVPVSAYEEVLRAAGHSTVIIAALRNALIMDFDNNGRDPGTIIKLALSPLYEAQPLVEETLAILINESYTEVMEILESMLAYQKETSIHLMQERDELDPVLKKTKNKSRISAASEAAMLLKRQGISEDLFQILRIRSIAISIIYKIFRSPHAEALISNPQTDPNKLLWLAMSDPLPEVRDNASTYIYYISRFNSDMAYQIITALSDKVMNTPVSALLRSSSRKELQQSYIEPACRVGLFLAIDGLLERGDYQQAVDIQNIWKNVVSKFTLNHVLIRLVWPFFKLLMSRQATVQKEYVNNGVEYGHFWDHIPKTAGEGVWSQSGYGKMVDYLDPQRSDFKSKEALFLIGYKSGDSYSLFLLERILIVQGLNGWEKVAHLVRHLSDLPAGTENKAYIEMSVIYAVYQINLKSQEYSAAAEKTLAEIVEKWQIRHKGYYFAHYNDKANAGLPYKQYVLNWYASVYCRYYGDGEVKPGEQYSVQLIRDIITDAVRKREKALLYNCIENVAMLAATSGYYKTALQLFEHLIGLFRNESEIHDFDIIKLDGQIYEKGLRSFICDMLGTVKSYYPKEVDHFVVNKLKAYRFPDLDAFREEIFNHSLSHENIGDLLTHKFGNFVIWGIVNDRDIRHFFMQVCQFGPRCNSYFEWFDKSVRYSFQEVLGVKNFAN